MAMLLSVSAGARDHDSDHQHDRNITIDTSSRLLEWCKAESEAHFIGTGVTPYNWSANWWEKGNVLRVKGSWLVGREHVEVNCHIAKGARKKYAVFEIAAGKP